MFVFVCVSVMYVFMCCVYQVFVCFLYEPFTWNIESDSAETFVSNVLSLWSSNVCWFGCFMLVVILCIVFEKVLVKHIALSNEFVHDF